MQLIRAGDDEHWEKDSLTLMCSFNCNCNFQCSYCINKNLRKNYTKQFDKDVLVNFIHDLRLLNKAHYQFYIAGGEPTLYRHLGIFYNELQQTLSSSSVKVILSTNGSSLSSLYPAIESSPGIKKVFVVSLHLEQMSLAEYKRKLQVFAYPKLTRIKMLLLPGALDAVKSMQEFAEHAGYDFFVHSITQNGKLHQAYSQEERAFLACSDMQDMQTFFNEYSDEKGERKKKIFMRRDFIADQNLLDYSGLNCSAGYNSLRIMPDGMVTRCYRDQTGVKFCLVNKSILEYPNIYSAAVCKAQRCACPAMLALAKWRGNENRPHYLPEVPLN